MNRYEVMLYGRRLGALGISDWYYVTVDAESKESAALKAYDTHEHIARPIFVRQLPEADWTEVNP